MTMMRMTVSNLAAFGEVLDVAVASVLTPRNGPGSLLGCLLELGSALLQGSQKGPHWLGQVSCITPEVTRVRANAQCPLDTTTIKLGRNGMEIMFTCVVGC